jgi:hypothetical protein
VKDLDRIENREQNVEIKERHLRQLKREVKALQD